MVPDKNPLPESSHIRIECSPTRHRVVSGATVVYTITIENCSEEAQQQSLELRELPPEWYALEFDESRLAFPGEQRTASLIISVPDDAEPSTYAFQVMVEASGEERVVSCALEVMAAAPAPAASGPEIEPKARAKAAPVSAPGVSVSPSLLTWEGGAAVEEWLSITVWNTGSEDREYVISLEGLPLGWFTLPPKLRVPGGEAMDTTLRVHPPTRAMSGDYPLKVRVALDAHPDVAADAQARLRVSRQEPVVRPPPTHFKEKVEEPAPTTTVLPPEVSLAPRAVFRFGPGELSAQAVITVQNKSDLIERYEIQIRGVPEEWYGLATSEVRLDPGGSAQVALRFTPRPGPSHPAGEYACWVRVAPHRSPDSYAEVRALLTIVGVPAFDARLTPAQAQGRKEKFTLSLLNTGALPLSLHIEGSDLEKRCRFKFPRVPTLDPGQASAISGLIGTRRVGLLGQQETFDFRLRARLADGEATADQTLDGRLVHEPLIGFRVAFVGLFLTLLALVVGLVVFAGSESIGDAVTWVGCKIDGEYLPAKNREPQRKPECGGPPRGAWKPSGLERAQFPLSLGGLQVTQAVLSKTPPAAKRWGGIPSTSSGPQDLI